MGNTAALAAIQKDAKMHAAFETFLERQKLGLLYQFARIHKDERTAWRFHLASPSSQEMAFAKDLFVWVKAKYDGMVHKEINERMQGRSIPKNEAQAFLAQIYLDSSGSAEWKKIFKMVKIQLNQRFSALAAKEFPHTPEYAACYRKKVEAEARKAAKELELERELDAFLGLAVSVGTGDRAGSRRFSETLAKKHKPKKGKAKTAGEFLAFFRKRFG